MLGPEAEEGSDVVTGSGEHPLVHCRAFLDGIGAVDLVEKRLSTSTK